MNIDYRLLYSVHLLIYISDNFIKTVRIDRSFLLVGLLYVACECNVIILFNKSYSNLHEFMILFGARRVVLFGISWFYIFDVRANGHFLYDETGIGLNNKTLTRNVRNFSLIHTFYNHNMVDIELLGEKTNIIGPNFPQFEIGNLRT
jgi:hypothetical protein